MTPRARRSSSATNTREVVLGRVVGVFGFKGEVRLFLDNPESDWLFVSRKVALVSPEGERREVRLQARSGAGKRVLGAIEGVSDEETARSLMGWRILARMRDLPPPDPGEWYQAQLLGMEVITDTGRRVGTLHAVHQNGPVDVWEIQGPAGTHYLPVLEAHVLEVRDDEVLVADEGLVYDDPASEA